jgi:uncharacterized membrane protein YdfJ with MMPL/SSD domain
MSAIVEFIVRRPRLVIIAWVLGLIAALAPAGALQDRVSNGGYDVAGSQSRAVVRVSADHFDGGQRQLLYVVLHGTSSRTLAARAQRFAARLRSAPELASPRLVVDPQTEHGIAVVAFSVKGTLAEMQKRVPAMQAAVRRLDSGAQLLGEAPVWHESTRISQEDLAHAEALALPLTLLILLVAFLSAVAAGLPIVLAGVALVVTFAALSLLGLLFNMSVYVSNTASALGLGLAIDYSLFIVTRYRELRAQAGDTNVAIRGTLHTTGRAILFSGITVALALSSLAVIGVGVFASMALGASVAAAIGALGALTLVPAILSLLGHRIDRLQLRPAVRAAASGRLWERIARGILRRPRTVLATALALLIACALPLFGSHLSFAGNAVLLPKKDSLRLANDAVGRAFGAGAVSPIGIVTNESPVPISGKLAGMRSIASTLPPERGTAGWYRVVAIPAMPGNTPAADQLIRDLRKSFTSHGRQLVYVGGETAQGVDLIERIKSRLPWMVAVACGLSLGLLLLAFRSIVIPVKAVLTNLLSVAATLGLVSLVFEDFGNSSGIAWFVPPFLFAIVFGLSMDYEIFLLSRVRDEHLAGASNEQAITQALVRNARPITLAALVMVTVFVSFALGRLETFRQLGVGMAIAVILDATIVRCALVPSALVLLGDRNWWVPQTLARMLPGASAPDISALDRPARPV